MKTDDTKPDPKPDTKSDPNPVCTGLRSGMMRNEVLSSDLRESALISSESSLRTADLP